MKPEALRLAAELEACPSINYKTHAAELRRLHAENQRIEPLAERVLELKAQRAVLQEALRDLMARLDPYDYPDEQNFARAAIKAVEEQK